MLSTILRILCIQFLALSCICYKTKINLSIDTEKPIQIVHPLSPSVATGLLIFQYGWIDYFNDTKFMTLARALAPVYMRVGGTKGDFTHYDLTDVESRRDRFSRHQSRRYGDQCLSNTRNEEAFERHRAWADEQMLVYDRNKTMYGTRRSMTTVTMTGTDWKKLNEFCQCVGWRLIFGLNLLNRNGSEWNSTNAEQLINYTENRYRVDWELGNEPNSYLHKTGIELTPEQVGEGFVHLKSILDKSLWWKSSLLLGPDANRIGPDSTERFLNRFMNISGKEINSLTFHQYYLNGRNSTASDFLNPQNLNKIIRQIEQVKRVVRDSGTPLCLGETASAYGGGAPGLSDSYIDGLMWLDKLGMTSRMGVSLVIRQTFVLGRYALIDSNFDPLPDYWLTLLYKKLVGNRVLNVTLVSCKRTGCKPLNHGHVRIYAHCTNQQRSQYRQGSVVAYFINLKNRSVRLKMDPFNNVVLKTDMYLLQPSVAGNLTSTGVRLNGKLLQLTSSSTIPTLPGRRLSPTALRKGIRLPKTSFGFIVFSNANAQACIQK